MTLTETRSALIKYLDTVAPGDDWRSQETEALRFWAEVYRADNTGSIHLAQGAQGDRCIGCNAFVPTKSGSWGAYGPLCYSCMMDAHPCDGCEELWPQSQALGTELPGGDHDYLCANCWVHSAQGADD